MTLYVDSSAMTRRYLDEPGHEEARHIISSEPVVVLSGLVEVEVRRTLAVHLGAENLAEARAALAQDLDASALLSLDADLLQDAAQIAERTLCRSLDSIHVAATRTAGSRARLLTYDRRQAQAARSLGIEVLGVPEE